MDQVIEMKPYTHRKRSILARNLILSILVGNLAHLVYSVENQKYQNVNNTDLIEEKTLPILNEAIPSVNIDNDNEVDLSPSSNANTKRLRHLRDANDDNTQLDGEIDNIQRRIQDTTLSYDNSLATSHEISYFNTSIVKHRNRYDKNTFHIIQYIFLFMSIVYTIIFFLFFSE